MNQYGFEILKKLGEGKFGHVYLAKKENQKFALKVIHGKVNDEVSNEVRLHSKLKHPNIIEMYDFIGGNKNSIIVLEYAPEDVFDRLESVETFSLEETQSYTLQIASALMYLHDLHIVHRDLKIENLLISRNGDIKLADFGFAVDCSQGHCTTFLGTDEYIAPEMLINKPYKYSVDIWALGVVVYEFLYSETPFVGDNKRITFSKIRRLDYSFPDPQDFEDSHEYILEYPRYRRFNDLIRRILKFDHERISLPEIMDEVQSFR